ncbi:gfo/Idh/MocA family oxidoreductase [bacterium]|nr:MAG: gfo/Idh/MocA family oxidoreductase [bacterium]
MKNPIRLAKELLLRGEEDGGEGSGDHCQYSGAYAEWLAAQWGLEIVDPEYFFTQRKWDEHKRGLAEEKSREEQGLKVDEVSEWEKETYIPLGTCGAVVIDSFGTICVATSTGGLTNKVPGRIGDTPTMGAGFWARYQLAGWRSFPEGPECVGVFDQHAEKAAAFGLPTAYDIEALLREGAPDFLDVVTSVEGHAFAVRMAIAKGLPVICQKPLAESYEESRALVREAEAAGVWFAVHENWRYQAAIRAVGDLLAQGVVGTPFRARIQFSCSFPVFENQPFLATLDRFILTDIGSHILDAARYLFGEVDSLLCRMSRVNPTIEGEDVATVMMGMERCPSVVCEMSYASRLMDENFPETYITVEGSEGSIELRKDGWIHLTTASGTASHQVVPPSYKWADPAYAAVHASIVACNAALYTALQNGEPAETSAADNLKTVALVWASYESAETGRLIDMKEYQSR